MKNSAQRVGLDETRSETVSRFFDLVMRKTRMSKETFAQLVLEQYQARVPEPARSFDFSADADVFRRAKVNGQHIGRLMDGTTRMPSDLEESVVFAFPEPYRSECVRDLALRYGLLDVPVPANTQISDMQRLSRLSSEFARVLDALGPMLDDGRLDQADAPHAELAMRELRGLLAAGEGLIARIEQSVRPGSE
ncbi:MAG TPA: hypothetical protein VHE37_12045 [Nevskiaceae bacterium]|nr:hypothetical protein [Nevskiaceae bacterium]